MEKTERQILTRAPSSPGQTPNTTPPPEAPCVEPLLPFPFAKAIAPSIRMTNSRTEPSASNAKKVKRASSLTLLGPAVPSARNAHHSVPSSQTAPLSPAWKAPFSPAWKAPLSQAWKAPRSPAWNAPLSQAWNAPRSPSQTACLPPAWNATFSQAWKAHLSPSKTAPLSPAWKAGRTKRRPSGLVLSRKVCSGLEARSRTTFALLPSPLYSYSAPAPSRTPLSSSTPSPTFTTPAPSRAGLQPATLSLAEFPGLKAFHEKAVKKKIKNSFLVNPKSQAWIEV